MAAMHDHDGEDMRAKSGPRVRQLRLRRDGVCLAVGVMIAATFSSQMRLGSLLHARPSACNEPAALTSDHTGKQWHSKQLELINEWVARRSQVYVFAEVEEQLGKAGGHMEDVFELCARYDRTCVLPRFSNGHVRLDGAVDFEDVYDLSSLPDSMSTVSWRAFADNLIRIPNPTVMVCVFGKQIFNKRRLAAFVRVLRFYSNNATFDTRDDCMFDMVRLGSPAMVPQAQSDRVDSVLVGESAAAYDVVAFFHLDWFFPVGVHRALVGVDYQGLDVSPDLYRAAIAFREHHGDYILLQWRMEKTVGTAIDFPACAHAAVAHIKNASASLGIHNVYVSADVGRDGLPWSGSFGHERPVPAGAVAALDIIYAAFPRILTWEDIPGPRGRVYDLAVVGLLEKLIAQGATYFIRGTSECARTGSYSTSIAKWRQHRRTVTNPRHPEFGHGLRNSAEWWSLKDLNVG